MSGASNRVSVLTAVRPPNVSPDPHEEPRTKPLGSERDMCKQGLSAAPSPSWDRSSAVNCGHGGREGAQNRTDRQSWWQFLLLENKQN